MSYENILAYVENILAVLRTAGALLIGNSVLVKYGVIGHSPDLATTILGLGLTIGLLACLPLTKLTLKKG